MKQLVKRVAGKTFPAGMGPAREWALEKRRGNGRKSAEHGAQLFLQQGEDGLHVTVSFCVGEGVVLVAEF